ncbi:protein serine/threonine phosphatase 2C [Penicillium coprophilum]|uniref:protein serine/threonine phosphatase 2C n=1 Tax=Penicillium coprophilum TaxID=36646 RepID=UPI00238FCAB6|nr:protein serine/threonine phosphatase 2C [Penicillium coprophilum]KAJ5165161.1 protein serine/threonine phosphatase 2C [Penicillium coprophilum]
MVAGVVGAPAIWWLENSRDDAPYIESPPAEYWSVEPGPSKAQVTRIISQGAFSFPVRHVAGVTRYDGAQLASDSPCEDQFTHGKLPSPWKGGSKWMARGVFDGHSGPQKSELLKTQLLPFVRHSLSQMQPTPTKSPVPDE